MSTITLGIYVLNLPIRSLSLEQINVLLQQLISMLTYSPNSITLFTVYQLFKLFGHIVVFNDLFNI